MRCGSMVPSALVRRMQPKHPIVDWDPEEALKLWTKRHPESGEELPDIIDDISEVMLEPEREVFCRNSLVLKPETSEQKLIHTTDDE